MGTETGGNYSGPEAAVAVAIQNPLPAIPQCAGTIHFCDINIFITITVDITNPQRMTMINIADKCLFGPAIVAPAIQVEWAAD